MSTEPTINAAIVSLIQGLYSTLGFSTANGNVKSYLLEFEHPELMAEFVMAAVTGEKDPRPRVWAVQVATIEEPWISMKNEVQRIYKLTIEGHYGIGASGAGVTALINGARAIRAAIKAITSDLNGLVDTAQGVQLSEPRLIDLENDDIPEAIVSLRMDYILEKINPTF